MKFAPLHRWDLAPDEAVALQKQMAASVDTTRPLGDYELVAGADVSYNRFSPIFYAAVVLLRRDDWSVVEVASAVGESTFPYIPGLLSFREAPILLEAFANLKRRPDVVVVDGQGTAHPRRLGIGSHIGLWLGLPTVGCGKTRLCGKFDEPGPTAGDWSPLTDRGQVIGSVLRTKARTKPLFVSPGHLIDLPGAIRVVMESVRGYRQPEPTRQAHLHVNEIRRRGKG